MHINKGITKTYDIFNDGWNYSKVFYFILGLQKTVGDEAVQGRNYRANFLLFRR